MLSIASLPPRAPPVVLARSPPPSSPFGSSLVPSSIDSCVKDGRRIRVGDCALFQAGDAPPFIGLIRWLSIDKEDCLKVCVNWLYRPADIKLPKGILLEAAPNEVFYSFHKDVITAASLLHPCKIYFLRKGVELPAGISSFVCRRVYDIANKCLWWLTDQDYINERQEEVDHLLDKTQLEMHAAVQSGGRSPKSLNGPTSTQLLKSSSDSVQTSGTSFSSQANKGKKRDRGGDQGTEPIKRERLSNKPDDVESVSPRIDMIKSEVAKITEKGALINLEGCEKLVHLMQLNRNEKLDLAGRIMLADVIAGTDKIECVSRIVQLRGVPILDDWLQEAHKGKTGDGSSPKESDKGSENLLFALLRALDKLPVNLNALQSCNIGKSVNNLRSHKNPEIQKKARSLVDTWKKRVDAEIAKTSDAKSGGPSTQAVTLSAKTSSSDVPQLGSKATVKTLISQSSPCNKTQVNNKHGHIDTIVKSMPVTPVVMKSTSPSSLPSSVAVGWKDSPGKGGADSSGNYSELPLATAKEENCNSSQSQYNSQSCSSDHTKTLGSSCKEDLRSSTTGSLSASKTFGSSSGHRSFSNGFVGNNASGGQKDSNLCKTIKVSNPSGLSSESAREIPSMDHGNNHRLVVRIPNSGRSPAQSTGGGSLQGPSIKELRHDDAKDGIVRSVVDSGLPPAGLDEELGRETNSSFGNVKGVSSLIEPKSRNSLNALIESFAKFSEPSASLSSGDDIGMNLLASVAAGEMSSAAELVSVSPTVTPAGSPKQEPCTANDEAKSTVLCEPGMAQSFGQSEENPDSDSVKSLLASEKLNDISKIEVKSSAVEYALKIDLANEPAIDESKPADPTCEKTADGTAKSSDLVGNSLGDKSKPADPTFGKTADGTTKSPDLVGNFSGDKCKEGIPSPGRKCENLVPENSSSSALLINKDQKPAVIENHSEVCERICSNVSTPSTSDKVVCLESDNVSKSKWSDEPKDDHYSESAQKELTTSASNDKQAGTIADRVDKVLEIKEAFDSVVSPVREAEKCLKSDLDKRDESTSSEQDFIEAKFDFDLNEGISGDDADQIQTEPAVSSAAPVCSPPPPAPVHLPIISAFTSDPTPNDTPAPVTVAAPNKGPFVPPENLLKTKVEPFGWKGSAATSAFRPAEPRKVLEMPPFNTSDAHSSDTTAIKQGRSLLDFDLNVADLEDMASSLSSPHTTGSVSGVVSNNEALTRSAGGLDLDLNKVDEGTDTVQFLGSASSRKPFSGGLHNGEANMLRGFDLNNGPGADEVVGAAPLPESQHVKNPNNTISFLPPITGLRMGNNAEIGNGSSWFPHGNSFQAVAAPSFLPDRQQHPYSLVAAPGAQRILGSVTGSINGDIYRGPVLSSSPAMSFSPATPFPYAGFPFGSSFPLPPSYSGGPTTYADSSQLVGPGNAVFSNYIRSYVPSLPEGSVNAGSESSRKWGGQGLDLNAGAGSVDLVDVKDDRFPSVSASASVSASRQLPRASSHMFGEDQTRMYQVSGSGGLKRKEREGGGSWDERLYKQPSWQ